MYLGLIILRVSAFREIAKIEKTTNFRRRMAECNLSAESSTPHKTLTAIQLVEVQSP